MSSSASSIVKNRSAEMGGDILTGPLTREWPKLHSGGLAPVALKILDDAVITTIESPSMNGIGWYDGKTVLAGEFVLCNVSKLVLASGTVQAIFGR